MLASSSVERWKISSQISSGVQSLSITPVRCARYLYARAPPRGTLRQYQGAGVSGGEVIRARHHLRTRKAPLCTTRSCTTTQKARIPSRAPEKMYTVSLLARPQLHIPPATNQGLYAPPPSPPGSTLPAQPEQRSKTGVRKCSGMYH